jgi:hypothetical protein
VKNQGESSHFETFFYSIRVEPHPKSFRGCPSVVKAPEKADGRRIGMRPARKIFSKKRL